VGARGSVGLVFTPWDSSKEEAVDNFLECTSAPPGSNGEKGIYIFLKERGSPTPLIYSLFIGSDIERKLSVFQRP
jgi:hypothetical protein